MRSGRGGLERGSRGTGSVPITLAVSRVGTSAGSEVQTPAEFTGDWQHARLRLRRSASPSVATTGVAPISLSPVSELPEHHDRAARLQHLSER